MTEVFNLATSQRLTYSCDPQEAVVAAYAQERGDYLTWGYAKYASLVRTGPRVVSCGDWTAMRNVK